MLIFESKLVKTRIFRQVCRLHHTATSKRTTKNCESFHSHINEQFYKAHPSFFTFLQILKDIIQTDTYIKINSANNCKKIPKNKKILNHLKITEDASTNFQTT